MTSPVTDRPRSNWIAWCWHSAALGVPVWCGGVSVLPWKSWAEVLVLLAALAICPLALFVVAPTGSAVSRSWRLAVWLQLPAALLLFPSFALPAGPVAASFSLPWLLFTVLVALYGLQRLRVHRRGPIAEWCVAAGLLYLAIGGAWLTTSRLGAEPLGFTEPIVLLTAGHFHYAGLVLPLLAGLAGRELPGAVAQIGGLGVIAGVPLVAVGITIKHLAPQLALVEGLAAWFLSAASLAVVWLQIQLALRSQPVALRVLLLVSAASLLIGMALATGYAAGAYWETSWLDIPTMLKTHAVINAVGFAGAGLLAWSLDRAGALGGVSGTKKA